MATKVLPPNSTLSLKVSNYYPKKIKIGEPIKSTIKEREKIKKSERSLKSMLSDTPKKKIINKMVGDNPRRFSVDNVSGLNWERTNAYSIQPKKHPWMMMSELTGRKFKPVAHTFSVNEERIPVSLVGSNRYDNTNVQLYDEYVPYITKDKLNKFKNKSIFENNRKSIYSPKKIVQTLNKYNKTDNIIQMINDVIKPEVKKEKEIYEERKCKFVGYNREKNIAHTNCIVRCNNCHGHINSLCQKYIDEKEQKKKVTF